ncbi:hypothetical protein O3G_MSEX011698 [Manduca sexta]|uniref:Uncharacterized protein n=1 Tax=Manduca sexta TaxID=7130 RepID=A0A921ZLE8_MANSE|nr:hypothetical protein O3G_MSEX011698 [Manduca sexta]
MPGGVPGGAPGGSAAPPAPPAPPASAPASPARCDHHSFRRCQHYNSAGSLRRTMSYVMKEPKEPVKKHVQIVA